MKTKQSNYYFEPTGLKQSIGEIAQRNANASGKSPIDRILNSEKKIKKISTQIISEKYKFSPYNLKLFLKGRGNKPREISIPNLLDQAILKSLDKEIKVLCPIDNQTELAFFIVKNLKESLKEAPDDTCIMKLDVKEYFDAINHDILLEKLKSKKCPKSLIRLIRLAIKTPAKERGEKTPNKNIIGTPQGLSISSYLADLYLEDFDRELKQYCIKSFRYVDDILVLYKKDKEKELMFFIDKKFDLLGLTLHKEGSKFFNGSLFSKEGFDFLGYHFYVTISGFKVSVRNTSTQKFINSLVGLITKYRKGGYDFRYPDVRQALKAFEYDINEKITGAFKDDQRYGWLWYFRQMDDLALLDKIDKIIKEELGKDADTKQIKIKRLKRAYYEINKFTSKNTYILNYGLKDPEKIKKYFSEIDGRIAKAQSEKAILLAFNNFINTRLRKLMLDEVRAS